MRAFSGEGAEKYATDTETAMTMTAVTMLCQRNKVWVSGMSPLMANSEGGMADLVAISIAAEDERPSAHTEQVPR